MKFETGCELIDATSISRPDTSWRFTDAGGHVHVWFEADENGLGTSPATSYSASRRYVVPSVVRVVDAFEEDEDGQYEVAHLECSTCGAVVVPGRTADATTQYVAGLRWFRIDGRRVTREEFLRAGGPAR